MQKLMSVQKFNLKVFFLRFHSQFSSKLIVLCRLISLNRWHSWFPCISITINEIYLTSFLHFGTEHDCRSLPEGCLPTVVLHSGDWLSKLPCLSFNSTENYASTLSVENVSRSVWETSIRADSLEAVPLHL